MRGCNNLFTERKNSNNFFFLFRKIRFRIPFSEALYLELQEDRFFDSAKFFKSLIIQDYLASNRSNYVPTLTRHRNRMQYLVQFLKLAEKFSKRSNNNKSLRIKNQFRKKLIRHQSNLYFLFRRIS